VGAFALALSLGACQGQIGSSENRTESPGGNGPGSTVNQGNGLPPGSVSQDCKNAGTQPGDSPIRRLTRTEYNNTVHDLLGDTTLPATAFTQEEVGLGFTNNANVQTVSDLLAEEYETAASNLAATAVKDLPKLLGCDPTAVANQDACMKTFLQTFGQKAYRRPLDSTEVDRLFAFYGTAKKTYDFASGVRLTIQAMLQSPHFLYRVETGASSMAGVQRVTAYETASRLSYLLWGTMPDSVLFMAAASGELDTPAGIAGQAQRMLKDPRTRQSVGSFFSQWLDLDKLSIVEKDAMVFPKLTTDIRKLMRTETEMFVTDVVFGGGGNLTSLLTGNYTFMNKDLATYYGVTGPTGADFVKVTLDSTQRAGVLTQGGIMASYANNNQTSPVARGFFIRDRFLCSPPPPPPANVNAKPPVPNPNLTTRERFAMHRTSATCANCHQLMDPVGLGFEHFDGAGMWRDTENGKPIDATGEFVQTDIDGPFNGAVEMSTKLSQSQQVRECMVKEWFRFSYGRAEGDGDSCTLEALNNAFNMTKGDINQLLVTLTQTDVFLYRTNESGGAP
jgi:hypothetical protein